MLNNFSQRFAVVIFILFVGSTFVVSCKYDYNDNYSFAKENEPYLNAAMDTAYLALLSDSRIKAILKGDDEDQKTLQKILDKLKGLKGTVDGVAYVALIEGILRDGTLTQSTVSESLAAVSTMLQAMAAHDQTNAIAESVRDQASADAARAALSAYAAKRSEDSLKILLNTYFDAVEGSHKTLALSSPVASAIVFAASKQASAGPDSIKETVNALKHANGSTVDDDATESQRTGVNLIALLISQTRTVLAAAESADRDAGFKQSMVLQISRAVNSAGAGMAQVAAVVSSRVVESMIEADKSKDDIAKITNNLVNIFEQRNDITTRARAAASGNAIAGAIAKLNQLISFVNTQAEVDDTKESISDLAKNVREHKGTASSLTEIISDSNDTLANSVTSGTSGGGASAAYRIIGFTKTDREGKAGNTAAAALTALDNECVTDFGAGYKALVYSASLRDTTTDWVLKPNTEYRRADGTTIVGTTDADALFTFPLSNPVGFPASMIRIGLTASWAPDENCANWTDNDPSRGSAYGMSINTGSDAIYMASNGSCSNFQWRHYCVQQ